MAERGVVAVDWSGARGEGQRRKIWRAWVVGGEVRELADGFSREEAVAWLVERAAADPELVAGLDFPFGFPAWFAEELGAASGPELWDAVAELGEGWLADPAPPFFGTAGTKRPDRELLRHTDLGLRAKSAFQIGGPGAPGTGGIRGMPLLRRLREEGFAVWPFDDVRPCAPVVLEVYPRALTGPVNKSDRGERVEALGRLAPDVSFEVRELAAASDDAFDALISAMAMSTHRNELRALPPGDEKARIEGRIWAPASPSRGRETR